MSDQVYDILKIVVLFIALAAAFAIGQYVGTHTLDCSACVCRAVLP
jgi:hypothetical protein